MKKLIFLLSFITAISTQAFAQPANDNCSGATNLGNLPTPGACILGVQDGAATTLSGQTTVGATSNNPYNYLTGCSGSASSMAAPALDTWYRFTATGTTVNINISGFPNASVALWTGTCGNLLGRDCMVAGGGGSGTLTVTQIQIGQTYYIQVSGNSATATDASFTLAVDNDIDCDDCLRQSTLTATPLPVNGAYQPGQVVRFCFNITEYQEMNTNWLHGVQITFGSGWTGTVSNASPANTCQNLAGPGFDGAWYWYPSGVAGGWGPGFYFETTSGDTDPTDNLGDNCSGTGTNWNFCWDLTVKAACSAGSDLSVTVNTSGDGESGSWTSLGCNTDDAAVFTAIGSCCPPTMASTPACSGAPTGTVTATVPAPASNGPYDYVWTNSSGTTVSTTMNSASSTNTATGLLPGTYTVTVTDNNNCAVTATVTVATSTAPTVTVNSPSFCAGSSATLTASASGATAPYTYAWSPTTNLSPTTGASVTANPSATTNYTVTVTAANGCTATATSTVTVKPVPTVSVNNVTLCGSGSATLTATPSIAGGTYSWSTGSTAASITVSPASTTTYNVTYTLNGCPATGSGTVTINPNPNANFTSSANQCLTGNSFTFTSASATGTHSWSFGASATPSTSTTVNQSGVTFSTNGTYPVTHTVIASGCTTVVTQNVTVYPQPSITATPTPVSCNGGANGSISTTVTGGTAGFSYSWAPSGSGANPTGLTANTYTVTVTDANGCTATTTANVTQPTALTSTVSQVNVSCNGGANGTATVTPAGGTSPYTYSWNTSPVQTTATATGLAAGSYTCTITDSKGCVITKTFTITEPTGMTIAQSQVNPGCAMSNGSATATPSGGAGSYTYSWAPSGGTGATASGLAAGGYTVTVTDANGCTKTATYTLSNPAAPTATITASTNVNCNGASTGSATVGATGGTAPFTYAWSPAGGTGGTTTTYSNLAANTYTVTVTDAANCVATQTVNITQPPLLTASITSSTNPVCTAANGSITVTAGGGTPAYTYSWAPSGGTGATASGLAAGNYTVTVTDSKGCIKTATQTLTATGAITATVTGTNVGCFGASTGSASASGSTGTAPYTYSWNTGATAANLTNIAAGTYTATVTDANGCTATGSYTVTQPAAALSATTSQTNVACNGGSTGSATVTTSGGTSPYTYAWSPSGGTGATASGLTAGAYTCTITDANGCTLVKNFTITQPTAITASTSTTNAACSTANGTASVVAGGGTTPYTYAWSPTGGTAATATGLAAGAYTVTITDAAGCTQTASATVSNNAAGTATISTSTNVSCFGGSNGSATVTMSGGTAPFTYAWAPSGGTAATATGLSANTYNVTVTDANNCTATATVTITQPAALSATVAVGANVTCNGGSNGSLTATPSGGTAGYTYSWSPSGGASATASGLAAGSYTVTVTDSKGCITTASGTITQPAAISVSTTTVSATCGNSNGSATATVANGTSPYTYSWSPSGGTGSTATGLAGGSYSVNITDANGCTGTGTANVNNLSGPSGSITAITNVSCNGGADGSATVAGSAGTAPYTYSWNTSPVQTGASATSLAAGSYSATITDANGCVTNVNATITQPAALTSTISTSTNVSCNGGSNGSATVVPAGGTPGYTYSWSTSPAQTTATASGLAAGSYTVNITDSKGCTTTSTVTITQPAVLSLSSSQTNVTCNGGNNGTASVTASGGTPAYSYSWSPSGGSSNSATGLSAGAYTVTVTDNNGCTTTQNYTLTQPAAITTTTNQTNVSCAGGNNGTATVTPAGGTLPYTYAWAPSGGTAATAIGLSAGTYGVTITDANGCTGNASVTITEPAGVTGTINPTNILCNGACNGQASVTASGGTSPYTYLWNDPALQTTATATGLCAGAYTVQVTDANNCVTNINATITQPVAITLTTSTVDSHCNQSDGSATVTVANGTAPFTYAWSPGSQTTATASNIAAGTYTVTVTDANGCQKSTTANVTDQGSPTVSIAASGNVSCNGGSDGFANASISGGTPPYSYSWSTTPVQTTSTASNLAAGTYSIVISDPNGCTSNTTVTITEPAALNGTISPLVDVTCNGGSDGSATIIASGGTGPYTYAWTAPGSPTTATVNGLMAGTYTVTITDSKGCVLNVPVTISQPPALVVTTTNTTSYCNLALGSATATVANGTSPYSYSWSNGATSATANNLTPGSYTVNVTDVNGCTGTSSTTVGNVPAGTASISATTDASCASGSNGSATVSIGGGTAPYSYLWSNNQTTSTATGLSAGTYNVSVTDNNGCTSTASATVNEPAPMTAMVSVTSVTCYNTCNGSATAIPSGGITPYTYQWTDPLAQTGSGANNLCVGSDSVIITDANGCSIVKTYNVTQPSAVVLSETHTDATCGQSNGSGTVSATGGVGPYSYSWSNGASTQTAGSLAANTYVCTVTDGNGCQKNIPVSISNLSGPSLTISNVVHVSCFGGSNGQATVNASSGTSPYTYLWSNGSTNPTITNLTAGIYSVTVTDATNCTSSASVTISEPTDVVTNVTSVDPTCNGMCDGSATVSVVGGTGPYTYMWTPGSGSTPTINGLCFGTYSYVVTDANGCSKTGNVILNNPAVITASATSTSVLCYGNCDGTATVNVVSGGTGPFTYVWSPGAQTTATATGLCAGNYTVSIQDANGCPSTATVTVNSPTAMQSSISGGNASCYGICDGYAQVTVTGGTGSYTYSWSPNTNASSSVNNLCAGNYTVTSTDANGCSVTNTVTISQPQPLITTMTQTNVTCNGACDGEATAVVNGGTGPYSFIWTPTLQSSNNAINLCAGVHNLNVIDSNGCVVASSVTITEPTLLQLTTSTTPSNCGQYNGSASVSITGGVGPYVYQWNDSLTQTSANANGLHANSYMVTVTDAMGCSQVATANVNDLTGPNVTIVATTNPTCNGANNGTAITSISGGVAPYTIGWNPSTLPASSNQTGLDGGNFTITVTDNAGCVTSQSFTLVEPPPMVALVTSYTNPTCYLGCDGTAFVSSVGGTLPYTYSWNSNPVQNTQSASGLCDGTYTVTVTDSNGCTTTTTKTLTSPSDISISAVVINNVSCSGGSNGSVILSVSGGTPGYVYTWNPTVSTSVVASGLSNGTYDVTVTDSKGCTKNDSYVITEPPPIDVTLAVTPSTCGGANGAATVTVTGGQTPYTISWNPGSQSGITATNLSAGQYNVQVNDGGQCQFDTLVNITDIPGPSMVTVTYTDPLCYATPTGTATANPIGGTSPYTYVWNTSPVQTSQVASNLGAGTYSVTVTDNNGCQISGPVTLPQPQPVYVVGYTDTTICYGQTVQLFAAAGGGTGTGYTYAWTPDATWTGAGPQNTNPTTTTTYTVIATDANGCASPVENIIVTVTPPLTVTANNPVVCEGVPAIIAAAASGGNGDPITYQWCNGVTTDNQTLTLPNGQTSFTCDVTVSDGCSTPATATATITVNLNPVVFMSVNDPDGCEPYSPSFTASSTNGVMYAWNLGDGDTTSGINPSHTYQNDGIYDVSLTATSAQGCSTTITNTAFVTVFPTPVAGFEPAPQVTTLLSPTILFNNITSGGDYYSWNFGVTTTETDTSSMFAPQYTFIDTGHYTVSLITMNSFGCVDSVKEVVWVKPDYIFFAPNAFTPNGDGLNDVFVPVMIGAKTLQLMVFNRWGELIYQGEKGWDGTVDGQVVMNDVYVWKAKTVDILGNEHKDYVGHVTVVR